MLSKKYIIENFNNYFDSLKYELSKSSIFIKEVMNAISKSYQSL